MFLLLFVLCFDIKFLFLFVARAGWCRMKLAPVLCVVNRGSLVDEICYIEVVIFDSIFGAM